MRRLLNLLSMFSLSLLISCTENTIARNTNEIDNLIGLSTDLKLSIDQNGIPYYDGYSVPKEKFNELVVGAGWRSGVYMYEVVQNGALYYLDHLELWEPPFFFDFFVSSSVSLTEYINYYPDSLPYDVLLSKNDDFIYSDDGTVVLADGSFFMRVVYASSDVFQAFKLLHTDREGIKHYALCTFTKMTMEELYRFQTNYSADYYKYLNSSTK